MIINSCFFKNYSTVVQKNKIYRTDILKNLKKYIQMLELLFFIIKIITDQKILWWYIFLKIMFGSIVEKMKENWDDVFWKFDFEH